MKSYLKKAIGIAVTVSMVSIFSMMPVVHATEDGTAANPYLIDSVEEYNSYAAQMTNYGAAPANCYFRITTDLDFAGGPITQMLYMVGGLDGGNHVLKNFTMTSADKASLIGFIAFGSSISNLGVENATFTLTGSGYLSAFASGATAGSASIINCYANNVKLISSGSSTGETGELVEFTKVPLTITNCYTRNVSLTASGKTLTGLVGRATATAIVALSNCYTTNSSIGTTSGDMTVNATNCYAAGNIPSASVLGSAYKDGPDGYPILTWQYGIIKSVIAAGVVESGNTLTCEVTLNDGKDGTIEYSWCASTSYDGEFTSINGATGSQYTVSAEYEGQYIKCVVTSYDASGAKVETVSSQTLSPPEPPEATDVTVSGSLNKGITLKGEYKYYSKNDTAEGASIYQWYESDTADGIFSAISGASGINYKITNNDIGKYLKFSVTPVSTGKKNNTGTETFSESAGPVTDVNILESTNMIQNPGFENTTLDPWVKGSPPATISLTKDVYCSGTQSMYVNLNGSSIARYRHNAVALKSGGRYLYSYKVKAEGKYTFAYYANTLGPTLTQTATLDDGWMRIDGIVIPTVDMSDMDLVIYNWQGTNFWVDDVYVGELMLGGAKVTAPESISIPTTGTTSTSVFIDKLYNQLGTEFGMDGAEGTISLEDYPGVYFENNKLYVTDTAAAGTIYLTVNCTINGVASSNTIDVPVTLLSNDNKTPRAVDTSLRGTVKTGNTLNLSYRFVQVDNEEDKSEIKWYSSDSESGKYTLISGAEGKTFTITDEYKDKYIKAEILPKTADFTGEAVMTNSCGPAAPPVANGISISGNIFVGEQLKAVYTYYDYNNDSEGSTKIQWLSADSISGTYNEIGTESTYTLTENEANKYIKLRITPVSVNEPYEGSPLESTMISGPAKPVAADLVISKRGTTLIGTYKYSQTYGAAEGETICTWYVGGSKYAEGTTCKVNWTGTRDVKFTVTPVSSKYPYEGETVSKTQSVAGNSSGGGGGGGSSGGGSSSGIKAPAAISLPTPSPTPVVTAPPAISDMDDHWAKDSAQKTVDDGIMTVDENNCFAPDSIVTRKEIVTYMSKKLGLSASEYKGTFADISSDDEFAGILQTFMDRNIISKDDYFRPDDYVTREEMCKILTIALNLKNDNSTDLSKFSDVGDISNWALYFVQAAVSNGLMNGVSENEFSPGTNISKAQMAALLTRIK